MNRPESNKNQTASRYSLLSGVLAHDPSVCDLRCQGHHSVFLGFQVLMMKWFCWLKFMAPGLGSCGVGRFCVKAT